MEKLIKIKEDHYVVVDDSEINEGDWFYNPATKQVLYASKDMLSWNSDTSQEHKGWKKITHSTHPIEEGTTIHNVEHKRWVYVKYIDLQEVKELIGEVDVNKNMWYERNLQNPYLSDSPSHTGFKKGFELGYNQALEDNKEKRYTEEDMRNAILIGMKTGFHPEYHIESANRIIQSLQPKTEWEVEIVDGKLKLK